MTEFSAAVESAYLVDLVVRATILLGVSLALQRLLRRWPATTRHRLWTLTFVLLLALPGFRLFGPSWDMSLYPDGPLAGDLARRPDVPATLVLADPGRVATPLASLVTVSDSGALGSGVPPLRPWARLVLGLWAAGCGAALASLCIAARRFSRLVEAGQLVEDEAWLRQLRVLRGRLSIRAKVRLVVTEETVTPMTGGVCRPVILLPTSATDWSEARRHAVLAHELAHVRRRDALRQWLGRLALAVYWFHPLSWIASHLATARREEACDEEVLAVGTRPSDYAGHLLSLAENASQGRPALSLLMARRSQLERRIRAILSPCRPRPQTLVVAAAIVAAAVGGVSVSIANPTLSEPGVVDEVAGVHAAALQCAPASSADELSSLGFTQGLGEVLVCTTQGETVATVSSAMRSVEPDAWAALESEVRKQLEGQIAASP